MVLFQENGIRLADKCGWGGCKSHLSSFRYTDLFSFLARILIAAMADTAMNLVSPAQLDIIDGLRGLGMSNYVALPQVRGVSCMVFLADNWIRTACCSGRSVEV
jgi:hypothetical protein